MAAFKIALPRNQSERRTLAFWLAFILILYLLPDVLRKDQGQTIYVDFNGREQKRGVA